jgi:hypothetical protein
VKGIEGAQIAEGIWNLPSLGRAAWSAWTSRGAIQTLGIGASSGESTVTSILAEHMDGAVTRFGEEGFTRGQAAALADNPGLEAAFRGERIDTFFKESVTLDPRLAHLEVTPRFQFGPDAFDPATYQWWDVTTPGQWGRHVLKYGPGFGKGTPLFTP